MKKSTFRNQKMIPRIESAFNTLALKKHEKQKGENSNKS
jgi:hypothetical protein